MSSFIPISGSGGGDSSSAGLPLWTHVAGGGDPATGQFTADNANPALVTTLKFFTSQKGEATNLSFFASFAVVNVLWLKGPSGAPMAFQIISTANNGGLTPTIFTFGVSPFTAQTSWTAGDYTVNLWPCNTLLGLYSTLGITPVADGTYRLGLGVSQDGTETTKGGVITAVQEAQS